MKKYIIIILTILSILAISCDDKDSENISKITEPAELKLRGESVVLISKGESYIEPGYTAKIKDSDISDQVTTTPVTTAKTNKPGSYLIKYRIKNKDGAYTIKTRKLVVLPTSNLSSEDISGIYKGQREGKNEAANACNITQWKKGVFIADDFFAGYYNITRGFGPKYRLKAYFVLFDDNTYKVYHTDSPLGSISVKDGKYNSSTKTLTLDVEGRYGFKAILTKQ